MKYEIITTHPGAKGNERVETPVAADWLRVIVHVRLFGEILCRLMFREWISVTGADKAPAVAMSFCGQKASVEGNRLALTVQWTDNAELLAVGFCVEGINRWLTATFEKPVGVMRTSPTVLYFSEPGASITYVEEKHSFQQGEISMYRE